MDLSNRSSLSAYDSLAIIVRWDVKGPLREVAEVDRVDATHFDGERRFGEREKDLKDL